MNPLSFLQQALLCLISRDRSGLMDVTDLSKPLDLLARKIQMTLLNAIRDGATEIRYVPNDRYIQVLLTIRDKVQEVWPLPLFKTVTDPIAQRFRRIFLGIPSQRNGDVTERGTVHVGGHPVHLSISCTPSEHGDILIIGVDDPGRNKASAYRQDTACDDESVVVLEGAGEDEAFPSFESSEELWRWCCENVPPEEYDLSDGTIISSPTRSTGPSHRGVP